MKTLTLVAVLAVASPSFAIAPDGGVVTAPTAQPNEAKSALPCVRGDGEGGAAQRGHIVNPTPA